MNIFFKNLSLIFDQFWPINPWINQFKSRREQKPWLLVLYSVQSICSLHSCVEHDNQYPRLAHRNIKAIQSTSFSTPTHMAEEQSQTIDIRKWTFPSKSITKKKKSLNDNNNKKQSIHLAVYSIAKHRTWHLR